MRRFCVYLFFFFFEKRAFPPHGTYVNLDICYVILENPNVLPEVRRDNCRINKVLVIFTRTVGDFMQPFN